MTRAEAKAFIEALKVLRDSATDEQALATTAVYPTWKEEVEYAVGDRVLYNNTLYKVLQSHTSEAFWAPDISPTLFAKVLIPDVNVIPEWEQPDSTNPYQTGDKVTHNDKTWVPDINNNIWEPGVYYWTEV